VNAVLLVTALVATVGLRRFVGDPRVAGGGGWAVEARSTDRPTGWVQYRPPDRAFTVVAPADPTLSSEDTSIGPEHTVRFAAPQDQTYGIEWIDVAADAAGGRTDAELIDAWANALVQRVGGVLEEQDQLRAASHPGVGLRLEAGGHAYYLRIFAADGRLYEVAAVVPTSVGAEEAAAFVDSFRLLA